MQSWIVGYVLCSVVSYWLEVHVLVQRVCCIAVCNTNLGKNLGAFVVTRVAISHVPSKSSVTCLT